MLILELDILKIFSNFNFTNIWWSRGVNICRSRRCAGHSKWTDSCLHQFYLLFGSRLFIILFHFVLFFRNIDDVMSWHRQIQLWYQHRSLWLWKNRPLCMRRVRPIANLTSCPDTYLPLTLRKHVLWTREVTFRHNTHTIYLILQFLSGRCKLGAILLAWRWQYLLLDECLKLGTSTRRIEHLTILDLASLSLVTATLLITLCKHLFARFAITDLVLCQMTMSLVSRCELF